MMGDAMDQTATSGTGIDRIDIFLNNRDSGGLLLGQGMMTSSSFWQATVNLPTNQTGMHQLWFYVHSAVTGETLTFSVPVDIER